MKNITVQSSNISREKAIQMFEQNGFKDGALKPLKLKGKECDDVDYMLLAAELFDKMDKENTNKNLPTDYGYDPYFIKLSREVRDAYNNGVPKKDLYRYINSVIIY